MVRTALRRGEAVYKRHPKKTHEEMSVTPVTELWPLVSWRKIASLTMSTLSSSF